MAQPLRISLVTAVLNNAGTIERTLQSVAAQRYPHIDYIVMDGGSTDGTLDIIARYRTLIRHFSSAPDKSSYDALNAGLALAEGEIAGILSADDWLAPEAAETVAALAAAHPAAEVFCFGLEEQEELADGRLQPARYYCEPEGGCFTLFDGLYCQGLSRFYRTALLRRAGAFDEARYPKLADREWYMRIGLLEPPKAQTHKTLYYFRCHRGSISMGGGAEGTLVSLREMEAIARNYLREKRLNETQLRWVRDWRCFTWVRLIVFAAREGAFRQARQALFYALLHDPLRFAWRMLRYRLPRGFRRTGLA